ncbi:MAG TPA: MarR family transcriptional regulator [Bryobacteraceae bacterium]
MAAALMALVGSVLRAQRHGPAAALSILRTIGTRGRVRPSDIANELGVHQSTITRQVRALQDAGQVEVEADPDDGRSCFISLTKPGWEEMRRLTEVGLSRFALFVADWDAEEVRTLARLLAKFETSKAEVAKREHAAPGRAWQQK